MIAAVIFTALAAPAAAQTEQFPYDYLSAHPAYLNEFPTPEEIAAAPQGKDARNQDYWVYKSCEILHGALRDMTGTRQFGKGGPYRAPEQTALYAYSACQDNLRAKYPDWPAYYEYVDDLEPYSIIKAHIPLYIEWGRAQANVPYYVEEPRPPGAIVLSDVDPRIILAIIGVLVIGLIIFAYRRIPKLGKEKRAERTNALLKHYPGKTAAERRDQIIAHFQDDGGIIEYSGDFRLGQRHVGKMDLALSHAVKNFTIERNMALLGPGIREALLANYLLFNEGLITEQAFDINALTLIYEDGRGPLAKWDGWDSTLKPEQGGPKTAQEALQLIMQQYFTSAQSVIEITRNQISKLRGSENQAIRYLVSTYGF